MKLIEKLVNIILNFTFIIVILSIMLIFYSYIQLNILKQEYNTFFGFSIFNISSGSMKETIQIDDIIIIKLIEKDIAKYKEFFNTNNSIIIKEENRLNKGDIITFFQDDQIITHRIIEILDDGNFITKGDANNSKDSKVYKQNVIGKVVKIIPRGGVWIKVFSDSKVITCICITLIFIGITIKNNKKEDTKKRKRNRNHFSGFIKNVRGNLINDQKKEKKE